MNYMAMRIWFCLLSTFHICDLAFVLTNDEAVLPWVRASAWMPIQQHEVLTPNYVGSRYRTGFKLRVNGQH